MSCLKTCCKICNNSATCKDACPVEIKQFSERCDDEHYMGCECERFEEVTDWKKIAIKHHAMSKPPMDAEEIIKKYAPNYPRPDNEG